MRLCSEVCSDLVDGRRSRWTGHDKVNRVFFEECRVDHEQSDLTCGRLSSMENMEIRGPLQSQLLRDVNLRASAVNKERYQLARLRQEIIDEYEAKTRELSEYLNNMEAEFEHQRLEYERREAILRHENTALKGQLARGSKVAKRMLSAKTRKYKREAGRGIETSAIDSLKDETRQYEWSYRMEHNKGEELKAYVEDLQREHLRAEEMVLQRKKRMDQSKKRWELENRELRRKAALGWINFGRLGILMSE